MSSGGGRGAERRVKEGEKNALAQLERIYEGPIKGLQMAPEFFGLLSAPELANTPLGKSLALQNQLLTEVSDSLAGRPTLAGRLPADLAASIGENLSSVQGAQGIEGSPASAVQAALRFSGASEGIRQQRIASALNVLGATGAGSIFPSASQFLAVGSQRAQQAAEISYQSGVQQANFANQRYARKSAATGQLIGTGLALGIGAATGGLGLLGGGLAGGGLGGALGGAAMFSGLAPPGIFGSQQGASQGLGYGPYSVPGYYGASGPAGGYTLPGYDPSRGYFFATEGVG